MASNESSFWKEVRDTILDYDKFAYVRKVSDRFASGRPDVDVILRGESVKLELKYGSQYKVTKLQAAEHDAIRRAGGRVLVVTGNPNGDDKNHGIAHDGDMTWELSREKGGIWRGLVNAILVR